MSGVFLLTLLFSLNWSSAAEPSAARAPGHDSVKAMLVLARQLQDSKPEFNERLNHLMKLFSRLNAEGYLELASERKEKEIERPVEYDARTKTLVLNDTRSFHPALGLQALMESLQNAYDDRNGRPWEYLYEGRARGIKAAMTALESYGIENLRADLKNRSAALSRVERLFAAYKMDGEAMTSLLREDPGLKDLLRLKQAYERARDLRKSHKEDLQIDVRAARQKLTKAMETGGPGEQEALKALRRSELDLTLQRDWKRLKKEYETGEPLALVSP